MSEADNRDCRDKNLEELIAASEILRAERERAGRSALKSASYGYFTTSKGGIAMIVQPHQWRETALRAHGLRDWLCSRAAEAYELEFIAQDYRLRLHFYRDVAHVLEDEKRHLPAAEYAELERKLLRFADRVKPRVERRQLPLIDDVDLFASETALENAPPIATYSSGA
jgi:hypothetical protein